MGSLLPTVCTVLALTMAACGGSSDLLGAGGEGLGGPDGAWVLASAEPTIAVPDSVRITLTVSVEDGTATVGGTAACNGYGGEVSVAGGVWTPRDGGYAITEMGCEAPIQQAEAAYMQALQQVTAWSRDDASTLRLTGPDATLTYELLAPVDAAALTGTTWLVSGFVQGTGADGVVSSTATDVPEATVRFENDGTFTMFSGCRDFAGEWVASGDEVQLTSLGETSDSRGVADDGSLTCGDGATAQEHQVLEVFEGGFTTSVDGQQLTVTKGEAGLTLRSGEDG